MQNNPNILLRFIDLGLVLLMSFLAIADLHETYQEPLPSKDPEEGSSNTDDPPPIYTIDIPASMSPLTLLEASTPVCEAFSPDELLGCLLETELGQNPVFLLDPDMYVTVQQYVNVLDVCYTAGVTCQPAQ